MMNEDCESISIVAAEGVRCTFWHGLLDDFSQLGNRKVTCKWAVIVIRDPFPLPTVTTSASLLVERFALLEVLSSADLRFTGQVVDQEDQANQQRSEFLRSNGHCVSML